MIESSKDTPHVPTPSSRSKEDEKYEDLIKSLERKRSFWSNPSYTIDGKRRFPHHDGKRRFPEPEPLVGEEPTHLGDHYR